jgi:hypothetical protein
VLAVVQPAVPFVVDGALQPLGTVSSTAPLDIPPELAVYVKTIVRPVWEALTFEVSALIVPVPSLETVMLGELAIAVRLSFELLVDLWRVDQVWTPVEEGAVAPAPPLALLPYVIVIVEPPLSVTPVTVIT